MKKSFRTNLLSQQPKKEMLLVIFIYSITHFGLLLNYRGVWWDDWTLRGTALSELVHEYSQLGSFPEGLAYLHYFLNIAGPFAYRIITFTAYLASGMLLYKLINRDLPDTNLAVLCSILFSVLPLNEARAAAINIAYALSLCLFMLASYLIRTRLTLSCCLLFVSYMTASLLPFTIIILIIEILNLRKCGCVGKKLILNLRVIFLTLMPFLYWTIKTLWYRPTGIYESYNTNFSANNALYLIKESVLGIATVRFDAFMAIICLPIVYLVLKGVNFPRVSSLTLMILGIGLVMVGCFPYWAVGLIPSHTDWNSRHQLLMPFGLSLLLLGFIKFFRKLRLLLLVILVSIFISCWTNFYLGYLNETSRNEAIISSLRADFQVIKKCQEFLIFDDYSNSSGLKLRKRFYEWNGLLIEGGLKNSFTAIPDNNEELFDKGKYDLYLTPTYKVSNFERSASNIRCRIDFKSRENSMQVQALKK